MMTLSFSSEGEGQQDAVNNSGGLSLNRQIRNDRLVIKTVNSTYRFVLVDPDLRQGVLSGGALTGAPRSAILIGSVFQGAAGSASEIPGLKVGARAIFYLVSSAGMERLITSVVVNFTIIKGDEKLPPVSRSSDRLLLG